MTSKLTRERIEWLNYAATGLAAKGTEMAMSPQDVIALTESCLAALDSEPVVFTDERNLHHIAMGRETSLIWGKQNSEAGDVPLYRHAQQPVVPDDLLSMAASAIEDLLEHTDPNTSYYSGVWADVPGKLRAAMLQVGNSTVIPDGSEQRIAEAVELLKRAAPAMLSDDSGPNGPLVGRLKAQDVPGWIPVSERIPENGQHIIIFCDGEFVLSAQYRDGEFFDVVRDGDEFFETTSRCVTHWMPLPAAPQELK